MRDVPPTLGPAESELICFAYRELFYKHLARLPPRRKVFQEVRTPKKVVQTTANAW